MGMRPAGPGSCPKRMVMGPCGGVRADGSCEVAPRPCVFETPVEWTGPAAAPAPLRTVPRILTDFSSEPWSAAMLASVAAGLGPGCDVLMAAGVRPWMTLTCRDRNRIVLESELRGLRQLGVDAVLCVTGDARAYDVRPEVTQVFDLDGPRLAALAASVGVSAAVPETPAAPPRELRAFRLVQKQRAGAAVAVLHSAPAGCVAGFIGAAEQAGVTIPVLAGVCVYTDEESAAALTALPGLELAPAAVRGVLAQPDSVAAGIAAAARQARTLLGLPGVVGVNISGLASARGHEFAAHVQARS